MKSIKDLLMASTSDKQSGHRYGFLYDLLFSKVYHEKKNQLRVLEIGVSEWGDGSLKAFSESEMVSEVVGVDIHAYTGKLSDNMTFYKMDAYARGAIDQLAVKEKFFDIIIDDGSHTYEHQTFFLENYDALLNDGGLLICEDVTYLQVITEQGERDDVFVFDGWGNLELGLKSFTDPNLFRHNERIIVKAKSEKLTDYTTHDNKPHIPKLPIISRGFKDYRRDSKELVISVPLFHPDFPDKTKYNRQTFQRVHCKGAIWAAMSMIHNTDLGENGVPVIFHIEDKVWNDAVLVFNDFGIPHSWLRKMTLPEPSIELTADKPQYGKSLMALIDDEIDADVTMILDSDLFTSVTGAKLPLYKKLTMPILKRQPAMTYFHRKDIAYWWWVSVVMGSAPVFSDGKRTLQETEKLGYETLGFEKELETCGPNDKVNRFFADEYLKTFPRQHPARDFAVSLIPQCYTPCYAFSMWAEFNQPFIELDTLLNIPTYDWERDFFAAKRGLDCFAHIRVERGRSDRFQMPSIIDKYWDVFYQNVSRHV